MFVFVNELHLFHVAITEYERRATVRPHYKAIISTNFRHGDRNSRVKSSSILSGAFINTEVLLDRVQFHPLQ